MPKHTLTISKTLLDYDRDTLEIELEVRTDNHYVCVTRNYSTINDRTFDLFLEDTTIVERKDCGESIKCYHTEKPTKDGDPDPKTILGALWDALREKISKVAPDQISCEDIEDEVEVDPCYPDDCAPSCSYEDDICY